MFAASLGADASLAYRQGSALSLVNRGAVASLASCADKRELLTWSTGQGELAVILVFSLFFNLELNISSNVTQS